jgi:transcriptional regulator with XRE-family HTH domain
VTQKLNNYLRTYRKRAGFSQDDMAFLLGCRRGPKVSRYECFQRSPALPTAFAFEVIFRVPTRELFAGIYEQARRTAIRRARVLHRRLSLAPPDRMSAPKIIALKVLLESIPKQ